MTKKKKSNGTRPQTDTISKRYFKQAESILAGSLSLDSQNHVAFSLVKSEFDGMTKNILSRTNALLQRDSSGLTELNGGLSVAGFTANLGNALRNSDKDGLRHNLLVAFFHALPDDKGNVRLDLPEKVYQWVLQEKTIVPETETNDEWNGTKCLPGPFYVNGHFAEAGENTVEDTFTDEQISLSGDLVSQFFSTVVSNAGIGTHHLFSVLSEYENPAVIVFQKSGDGTVSVEDNVDDSLSMMTATLLRNGSFSAKLTSFIDAESNDLNLLMRENSLQEIRAWSASEGDIYALSLRQAQDAYCRDFATGVLEQIPENITYMNAWKIST